VVIRVAYDAQIFRLQSRGGVSRYFTELMCAYRSEPHLGVESVFRSRLIASRHLADAGLGRRWVVHPQLLRYAAPVLPSGLRSHQSVDLVHHTYYLTRDLEGSWEVPRITTIHDMMPELMPEFFPKGNPHSAKREYVALSSGLVFVSETSRRDLFHLFGFQDVPTAVAHLAPSGVFYPRPSLSARGDHYVLFVGVRGGYKEFDTLLRALGQIRSPSLSLVAVGGGALSHRELARVEELGLLGRVRQEASADEQLANLYSGADALVMPSRYEGFGLPVVEAMASGCPVVLSDIDAFVEIADEAARYFPVGDAGALAALLDQIHGDAELRRTSRETGLSRIKDFTWARTARRTADLYHEVLTGCAENDGK
jgi:glycosyltransferase involved in cell wall biosynthesis